jgi:hypothetical protein
MPHSKGLIRKCLIHKDLRCINCQITLKIVLAELREATLLDTAKSLRCAIQRDIVARGGWAVCDGRYIEFVMKMWTGGTPIITLFDTWNSTILSCAILSLQQYLQAGSDHRTARAPTAFGMKRSVGRLNRVLNLRTCSSVSFRRPARNIDTALSEPNCGIRSRCVRFCCSIRNRTTETGSATGTA